MAARGPRSVRSAAAVAVMVVKVAARVVAMETVAVVAPAVTVVLMEAVAGVMAELAAMAMEVEMEAVTVAWVVTAEEAAMQAE